MATAAQTYADTCASARQLDVTLTVGTYNPAGQAIYPSMSATRLTPAQVATQFTFEVTAGEYTIGSNTCANTNTYNCWNGKAVRSVQWFKMSIVRVHLLLYRNFEISFIVHCTITMEF